MTFIVRRASILSDNKSPCDEAMQETIIRKRDNKPIIVWTVKINSLDSLIAFCEKYDSVIIWNYYADPSYKELFIYDDYIE